MANLYGTFFQNGTLGWVIHWTFSPDAAVHASNVTNSTSYVKFVNYIKYDLFITVYFFAVS